MKKIIIIFVFILIFIFGIMNVHSQVNYNKISPEVNGILENDSMRVIVEIKEPIKEEGFIFKKLKSDEEILQEKQDIKEEIINEVGEENVNHVFDNKVAVEITSEDLKNLKENQYIKSIRTDRPIVSFLSASVPLINATATWPLLYNAINLTGIDETICIIDTGANFSHPDLIGKNKTCVINCITQDCVENCSINDDNGHGTHVAGIAGAYGTIKGVAIGAKIISVKVLNLAGSGSGSDLEAGIQWCIDNYNNYNISVISMSLGTPCKYDNGSETGWCYNSYCDQVPIEESTALIIDEAISKNISVVIATGNNANHTYISSPACVKNATAVGATDKSDNIAIGYSNRNNLTDLFAPGSNIYSTMIPSPGGTVLSSCGTGNSYCTISGTSMATPHVAGAFTIVREFFRMQNGRVPTPSEIQNILNLTGKRIPDSQAGLNFSRIDILSAILYLDATPPNVTLSPPTNNTESTNINQTFICNSSDFQLLNVTFYIWNSTNSLFYNESRNITGTLNSTIFNVTNLSFESYHWNCQAYDRNNFSSYALANLTISINNLIVNLNSPQDSITTNQNQSFNCSFSSQNIANLRNSSFYIWNSTGSLIYNSSQNISGTINSSVYYYNFSQEGNYSWNCNAFDNNSDYEFSNLNYSIRYDVTFPNISSLSTTVSTTTATINWITSENTNHSLSYGTNINLVNNSTNSSYSLIHNISLSNLSSSTTYYYNITSCDNSGNSITNGTFNFTTPAQVIESSGSSGGGGGGGGGNTNIFYPRDEEIFKGYSQQLTKESKIIFNLSEISLDGKIFTTTHTMTLSELKDNIVTIIIKSNTINFTLALGQSKYINISSPDYYDIFIRFDEIIGNKAKITIKNIHENIIQTSTNEKTNNSSDIIRDDRIIEIKDEKPVEKNSKANITIIILISIIIVLLVLIILIVLYKRHNSTRKKENVLRDYREVFKNHIQPQSNTQSKNKRNKRYRY